MRPALRQTLCVERGYFGGENRKSSVVKRVLPGGLCSIHFRRRAWFFLACVLFVPVLCRGELDEVRLRLLKQFDLPLRWDNVVDCPLWVSGQKPSYCRKSGMYVVRLNPGAFVSVQVLPYQMVRIFDPKGPIAPGQLEISLSQGAGLHAFTPIQVSTDGKSVLRFP